MHVKNGKPRTWHGDKTIESHYGKLVRAIDDKANTEGKGKNHKECLDALAKFLNRWEAWKGASV